ncbi:MAG: flagellar biosynthesis protein FliQ [Candidatus Eisenbacteria bacterium]
MTPALASDLVRHALMETILLSAPFLLTALLVGVVVSLLQAMTQIQEQTLTFIPKLVAICGVILIVLPWFLGRLTTYLAGVLRSLSTLVA